MKSRVMGLMLACAVLTAFGQQVIPVPDQMMIVPERFLRSYDPITVFFPKATGPETGSPVDQPGDLFQLTPQHSGTVQWLDSRTLQFSPTLAWPALSEFEVSVQGVRKKLQTFMSAPTRMEPAAGTSDLEPFSEISFSMSYPVDLNKLSAMIRIEVRDLPGLDLKGRYWLSEKDFKIKQLERNELSEPPVYQLSLNQEIPFGKTVFFRVRLCLDEALSAAVLTYQWNTRSNFQLVAVGAGYNRMALPLSGSDFPETQALEVPGQEGEDPQDRLFLEFSSDIGEVSLVDIMSMVQFDPAVDNFSYRVSRKRVYFQFSAQREETYKMTLKHGRVIDNLNRQLEPFGTSSFYFFLPSQSSYLKWQEGQGILERYGPQEFAMEGLGGNQVDLRIYKIDPRDRNFWPFPEEGLVLNEEVRPAGPGEEPGLGQNMLEHIRQLEAPVVSKIVDLPLSPQSVRSRFGLNLKPYLQEISGANQAGTYLVGMRELGQSSDRYYVRLQVTDLCLTTIEEENAVLFVVTSLKTAKPIDGASVEVEIEEFANNKLTGKFTTLAKGITDEHGFFRVAHQRYVSRPPSRIVVSKASDLLVLDVTQAPPAFVDNHWYRSWQQWLGWWDQDPHHQKDVPVHMAHMFVERPVYRPEEVVHIKGYYRVKKNGNLVAGPDVKGNRIEIEGPGEKKWEYPVNLNSYGSFYHAFQENDLPTGEYTLYFVSGENNQRLGFASFKKEAYRIPRFEVRMNAEAQVPNDRSFQVDLSAAFYAGGKVVDSDVEWQVTERPYNYEPGQYPGFRFSTSERYGSGPGYENDTQHYELKTDQDGMSEITINPQDRRDGKPRSYFVEATVRGADEQTVSTSRRIIALPAFVLGLKMERFFKETRQIQPEVLVLDHKGEPAAGQSVHVKLMQRQWHSYLRESDFISGKAKYVTDVVDVPLLEQDILSQDKPVKIDFPIEKSGVYLVEITSRDRLGRAQRVVVDTFVGGEGSVSWEKPRQMVFETVWDKNRYEPGDQATLLLKSPFTRGEALVVVEGVETNTYQWLPIKDSKGTFTLQVDGKMAPQIPVHILISRGRSDSGQPPAAQSMAQMNTPMDLAKPMTMGNTSWLKVEPLSYRANLEMSHPEKVLPGQEMEVDIRLNRPDGTPLDGEVTLWLVDRAVLALGKEVNLDPVPSFLQEQGSWVRIRDTRNRTVGMVPLEEFPGGGGTMEEMEELLGKETVRKNFQTVPFYKPDILVSGGKATVKVKCPDNLTDFAVRAVATDGGTRFGYAKSKVSVRLPVIVQPALPRFVRPGDRFVAGGMGRIVEGNGGPGSYVVEVEGLELETEGKGKLNWEKDKSQRIYVPLKLNRLSAVSDHVLVRIGVIRDEDKSKDAFEVELPVKPDIARKFLEELSDVQPGDDLKLMNVVDQARPGGFRQSVLLSSKPGLIKMLAALDFLHEYPHSCTEQRVSQLLPELALKKLMESIGDDQRSARISHSMQETFKYLGLCQNNYGLFSYWPGSDGYVSLTAYVVEFLLAAKQDGYSFDEAMLTRAIRALKESLRSDYSHFITESRFFERAQALTALASASEFDESYATDFAARAIQGDLYSESQVLNAFLKLGRGESTEAKRMATDLKKSIVFALRDGKQVYQGLQYRQASWGGLINSSEIQSLAGVTRALFHLNPQDQNVEILVNELVSLGGTDGWGSTQANSIALITLGEILDFGNADEPVQATLEWNGRPTDWNVKHSTLLLWESQNPASGTLTLKDNSSKNSLVLLQKASYFPMEAGGDVRSESAGFVVQREELLFTDPEKAPEKFPLQENRELHFHVGDLVEEHIQLVNPEDGFFIALRIPFAAGFEPMNPNLATAPPEATPKGALTRNPSFAQYEDDQVTFYYDTLPKGTYHFYFRLKANVEGEYTHPAAFAEKMYHQSVRGNSNAAKVFIAPRKEL